MKPRICSVIACVAMVTVPVAATAQIALPSLPGARGGLDGLTAPLLDGLDLDRLSPEAVARQLRSARLDRLAALVRTQRDRVEFDALRAPALRGVLLATGVSSADRARAAAAGYRVIQEEVIAELDLAFVRFALPDGMPLRKGQKQLAELLPQAEIAPDNLYFPSASGSGSARSRSSAAHPLPLATLSGARTAGPAKSRIGLIDRGVASLRGIGASVVRKGFATGAPHAADHGTAVAALALGVAGAGSTLYAADVYGTDPAGGTASAIARALGWLTGREVAVINISLVGPDNALVRAAIKQAQARGALIVAAVGNDGPAAPPAFPAAQFGVLAVTGVDARGRVLPEAGRGRHVAFAAPGRNTAPSAGGDAGVTVRGTSFAAPLVAGRLAQLYPAPAPGQIESAVRNLIGEARDLGKKGRDPVYGHGLVCADCGR